MTDFRIRQCPLTMLSLLLLFATTNEVQGWHSGLGLRSVLILPPSNHQHQHNKRRTSGGLFPTRTTRLFEQQQQQQQQQPQVNGVNGVNGNSHLRNDDITASNDAAAPPPQSRRARFKNRVSNLWSAIFYPQHQEGQTPLQAANLLSPPPTTEIVEELETENKLLRETIRQLEVENDRLASQQKVVLERFEGEGRLSASSASSSSAGNELLMEPEDDFDMTNYGITLTGEELSGDIIQLAPQDDSSSAALWCDDLDEDSCPVEPTVSFGTALRDRAYWLVGLLVMQSCSGLILSRNEALLANHPVIIYFLTMLVGAGGNAGNQASVRVIRGIALGTLNEKTQGQFLSRELKMAASLSAILSVAGFLRAAVFRTPFPETIAVTASLALIVFSSICLGAVLPLLLQKLGVDPAHSSTTIQVVMDILGVFVAVAISGLILDSPLGQLLINKLGG